MAIIAVNAGHYLGAENYDPGACNEELGLKEAEINVAVARKLEQLLVNQGHKVVYIHAGELYEITDASNNANADLFVSLHCNSAANPDARGIETFCHATSRNGANFASTVQAKLIEATGLIDRGVKTNPLYVTKRTTAVAILVEMGFISNMEEGQLMATEQYQSTVAQAICDGVIAYLA